jgi:hypothetical protein
MLGLLLAACGASETTTGPGPGGSTAGTCTPLPDAWFKATITGDDAKAIEFTLPMGTFGPDGAINGSFVSAAGILQISATRQTNPRDAGDFQINLPTKQATAVTPGTYALVDLASGLKAAYVNLGDPVLATDGFAAISGDLVITRANPCQTAAGMTEHFVSGTFSFQAETSSQMGTITASGEFRDINMKSN